jgi:3D (Asp-Asp-Asp) domain-containing protein
MIESRTRGNSLTSAEMAKRLILSLFILAACDIAGADQFNSPLLIHKNQPYVVKSETIRIVTAYNAGDPNQTDDTPCISANGENICDALAKGQKRCAANFVPLGSKLYVDKIGVCLVTDRTNKRYRNRVDIAMRKDEYHKALRFGRQKLQVKIIHPISHEKYSELRLSVLPWYLIPPIQQRQNLAFLAPLE